MPAVLTDLATQTLEAIDTEWARQEGVLAELRQRRAMFRETIAKIEAGEPTYRGYRAATYQPRLAEVDEKIAEQTAAMAPLHAEYERRGGWTRFWLVTNHDGHVHRTLACPTTFPTTQWGWQPHLAGLTDEALIEAIGERACTVCFPDAPVHPAFMRTVAEREAAEAAKAALECPMGRQYVPGYDWRRRYAKCPECGEHVSVTRGGKFRAHKRAVA